MLSTRTDSGKIELVCKQKTHQWQSNMKLPTKASSNTSSLSDSYPDTTPSPRSSEVDLSMSETSQASEASDTSDTTEGYISGGLEVRRSFSLDSSEVSRVFNQPRNRVFSGFNGKQARPQLSRKVHRASKPHLNISSTSQRPKSPSDAQTHVIYRTKKTNLAPTRKIAHEVQQWSAGAKE